MLNVRCFSIPTTVDAKQITQRSKSNLALAFVSLGKERRADITTFYAFCRVIDDIADSDELTPTAKAEGLAAWRRWLASPQSGEDLLAGQIRALIAKYRLTPGMLDEI